MSDGFRVRPGQGAERALPVPGAEDRGARGVDSARSGVVVAPEVTGHGDVPDGDRVVVVHQGERPDGRVHRVRAAGAQSAGRQRVDADDVVRPGDPHSLRDVDAAQLDARGRGRPRRGVDDLDSSADRRVAERQLDPARADVAADGQLEEPGLRARRTARRPGHQPHVTRDARPGQLEDVDRSRQVALHRHVAHAQDPGAVELDAVQRRARRGDAAPGSDQRAALRLGVLQEQAAVHGQLPRHGDVPEPAGGSLRDDHVAEPGVAVVVGAGRRGRGGRGRRCRDRARGPR